VKAEAGVLAFEPVRPATPSGVPGAG